MAAPKGNQNAAKARIWTAAIQRALAKRSLVEKKEMLDELADKLIDEGMKGDLSALKEIGDRLEGKVAQNVELSGPLGGPIEHEHDVNLGLSSASRELLANLRGIGGSPSTPPPVPD